VISYPRTSSEQIPPSIDVKQILNKLGGMKAYQMPIRKIMSSKNLTPVQGKKTDPAHPAIHPTGEKPTKKLTPSENKVYDLIVRRFLSLLGTPATKERMRIDLTCEGHGLIARGLRVLEPGWIYAGMPVTKLRSNKLAESSREILMKKDSDEGVKFEVEHEVNIDEDKKDLIKAEKEVEES